MNFLIFITDTIITHKLDVPVKTNVIIPTLLYINNINNNVSNIAVHINKIKKNNSPLSIFFFILLIFQPLKYE